MENKVNTYFQFIMILLYLLQWLSEYYHWLFCTDNDPKGGPDADCINRDVVQMFRQTCHGKVIVFISLLVKNTLAFCLIKKSWNFYHIKYTYRLFNFRLLAKRPLDFLNMLCLQPVSDIGEKSMQHIYVVSLTLTKYRYIFSQNLKRNCMICCFLVLCNNWSSLLNDESTCIKNSLLKNEWSTNETFANLTGLTSCV